MRGERQHLRKLQGGKRTYQGDPRDDDSSWIERIGTVVASALCGRGVARAGELEVEDIGACGYSRRRRKGACGELEAEAGGPARSLSAYQIHLSNPPKSRAAALPLTLPHELSKLPEPLPRHVHRANRIQRVNFFWLTWMGSLSS
jgi:hypothetical protein